MNYIRDWYFLEHFLVECCETKTKVMGRFRGEPWPLFFSFCFLNEMNQLLSGVVQSPQGCSCVVDLERCCALAKFFSSPSL